MAPHLVKPRPEGTLTEAVARLIEAVGIKRAAELVGASPNSVRRWSDDDYREGIAVHNVRLLELAARHPIVTEFLAFEAGCILLRDVAAHADRSTVAAGFARAGAEIAQMFAKLAEFLADDGRVSSAEAGALIREVDDVSRELMGARAVLQRIRDGETA